jgi:hypothetical protein
MTMKNAQAMNEIRCTWSQPPGEPPSPGPVTASMMPEPKTHAVSSMMAGPITPFLMTCGSNVPSPSH